MQVLVGDHIEGFIDGVEPRRDVRIRVERPRAGLRFEIQHRPQTGRKVHATVIAVVFVHRITGILVGVEKRVVGISQARIAEDRV